MNPTTTESTLAEASSGASIIRNASITEQAEAKGTYTARCMRVEPEYLARAENLLEQIALTSKGLQSRATKAFAALLEKDYAAIPRFLAWEEAFPNLVTTGGKNDALDKYLAGSSYTAAFYLGLISSTSYTAVAAGDTMASHAGWLEAGLANVPAYSQGTRPAAAWSAASAGAKALSSNLTYSITSAGTVKGCFLTSVSTKDGTTGILYSAGLFTGGDKVLSNTDSLSVAYTATL